MTFFMTHGPVIAGLSLLLASGCRPAMESEFVTGEAVKTLDEQLRQAVAAIVLERSGTPSLPKRLSDPDASKLDVQHGRDLYNRYCQQCHGVSGDGKGVAAPFLYPRPRDYRKGIFKFTSTPYGNRPRRDDLLRTLRRGIPGTSMPSFKLHAKRDLEALVDYVLLLTQRGELETRLALEAEFEEEIDPEAVPGLVTEVLSRWNAAERAEVHPLTNEPPFLTEAHVAAGREAFLSKGCSKCHGEDGRGMTKDNIGKDTWGYTTKAADLTSGLLHGGSEPLDIYRRIVSGINGTPMPGFKSSLEKEPETIWNLVAYVLHVSGQRRAGTIPTPGIFSMVTPESAKSDASDASASSAAE
ncbi:MAG: c-type cytochrome [Rhodopirellula sp.]|nr:c-type cytochrome [Rhodopirellula sp.]